MITPRKEPDMLIMIGVVIISVLVGSSWMLTEASENNKWRNVWRRDV